MELGNFDQLTPFAVTRAVEEVYGIRTDGTIYAFSSYVNRVYGLLDDEGSGYVAKFYRPGRWSAEAIAEEHTFVLDCAAEELPVVAPIADDDGETLQSLVVDDGGRENEYLFALYPRRGGRNFDAELDEHWRRLGALVGRLHAVGVRRGAGHRLRCTPRESTARFLDELRGNGIVHPDSHDELFELAEEALERIEPLFESIATQRIHGDCHRGNFLDRAEQGLLLIDFDDMMVGPAVQDLWLLLPDRAPNCERELELIIEGYEEFHPFDRATLVHIEPLRLMRMIYFLAWSALQRTDSRFRERFPDWGGKAFWVKEIEDLRDQLRAMRAEGV